METPCPADAPNAGKPCDALPSERGTEHPKHSGGPEPTPFGLMRLGLRLVEVLAQQALAIDNLAASNERLADEVAALAQDEPEDDEQSGVDMAGNPIRVS